MLKKAIQFGLLLTLGLAFTACGGGTTDSGTTTGGERENTPTSQTQGSVAPSDRTGYLQLSELIEGEDVAVITTNHGEIRMRFFPEYAPKAVENFITHARNGYYDGVIFHRVIKGFMIQGGDPMGSGMGGESIWGAPFEVEASPNLHHIRGAVSMARTFDPTSIGSQFFIVQNDKLDPPDMQTMIQSYIDNPDQVIAMNPDGTSMISGEWFPREFCEYYLEHGGTPFLNKGLESGGHGYSVFAQVFEGMDVVDSIADVRTGSNDKPATDVVIESIVMIKYGQ